MEHQYPAPISGDETMLAELMLPDQVHSRSQDWTIFFLHKDGGAQDESLSPTIDSPRQDGEAGEAGEETAVSDTEEEDPDEALEGPPLIYVLNHVNTKHDNTVQR